MKSEIPPHLRPGTIKEWLTVIRREGHQVSFKGKLALAWTLVNAAFRVGGVNQSERDARLTYCATQCPIYDPTLRRCGPWDGSPTGCHCYLPFAVWIKQKYDKPGCWVRYHNPESGLGWE
jgi:hypothetical protein